MGLVDEICFEDFMTVMSYFKPPEKKLTDEETETVRTAKLRCKNTILTAMTLAVYHSTYTERPSLLFSVVCHPKHLITSEHTPQNHILSVNTTKNPAFFLRQEVYILLDPGTSPQGTRLANMMELMVWHQQKQNTLI